MFASFIYALFIVLFWALVIICFILSLEVRKLHKIIDQGNDQWAKNNKQGSIKDAIWDTRKNKDKTKTPYKKEKDYINSKVPNIFALRKILFELFVALSIVAFVIIILSARLELDSTSRNETRAAETVAKEETDY